MVDMARKECAGNYQIGIWHVEHIGRKWRALATGALGESVLWFASLRAAHKQLTGEENH